MKTPKKRYQITVIVTYRKSNTTKQVTFDTLEEAREAVKNERKLHPRSKKFNPCIIDLQEKRSIFVRDF